MKNDRVAVLLAIRIGLKEQDILGESEMKITFVVTFICMTIMIAGLTLPCYGGGVDTVIFTGTFFKEDGTPAAKVRINIFEVDKKGSVVSYNATATQSESGGMEVVFDCPGTAVTDDGGKLVCKVDPAKFKDPARRFTLGAQYVDPKNPGTVRMLGLEIEKKDAVLKIPKDALKINLNKLIGKITVKGI